MAYFVFDSPLAGASLSYDVVHVLKGASFDLDESPFFTMSSHHMKIVIEGRVSVTGDSGVYDTGSGNSLNAVKIKKTGKLLADDASHGIYSDGIYTSVVNKGLVKGYSGVHTTASYSYLFNSGMIKGLTDVGVAAQGLGAEVVNTGEITGETIGVIMNGIASTVTNQGRIEGAIGVWINGSASRLFNDGIIEGTDALVSHSPDVVVENTGIISGELSGATFGSRVSIDNEGLIEAMTGAALQFDDFFHLTNSGTIKGDVLGAGLTDTRTFDDVFINIGKGKVIGEVHMGRGHDQYTGGKKVDKVFGGLGDDELRGMKGNDKIDGGEGDDEISGDQGDDKLTGGTGEDTFYFYGNKSGDDKIMDFEDGTDLINVTEWGFFLLEEDVTAAVTTKANGNVVIDLKKLVGAKSGTITLVDFADTEGNAITLDDFEHGPVFL